jgi:hypothetical protein
MRDNATMTATTWRRTRRAAPSRGSPSAALLAATILLAQCGVALPEDATVPPPPANYGTLIANALKKAFKNLPTYSNFQISPLRWVHAETGWNWLTCLRYDDHGVTRYYSFFIAGGSIVNSRYDVRTDRCAAQQYVPFDITTGNVGSPTPFTQQPIY